MLLVHAGLVGEGRSVGRSVQGTLRGRITGQIKRSTGEVGHFVNHSAAQ